MGLGIIGLSLRLLRAAPLLATLAATGWAMSTNPLAAPFMDRTTADLTLALERRVTRVATPEWIEGALSDSVLSEDVERTEMLLGLADDLGHPVDRDAAQALLDAQSGMLVQASACGSCMIDIARCQSVKQIAACAVPFEMSPLGDVNALRRAMVAWTAGENVDELDVGLALVGLGATAAIIVSGGSSATVKAGAGLLRLARRMGTVTPGLARVLKVPVRWDALPGYLVNRRTLAEVTEVAQLERAGAVVADLGRVREATSTAETLRLVRLVDGPEDAARLARVAEAMGPRTTRTFDVLGKGRVFRATLRLSRAAAGTLVLLWLTIVQLVVVLGTRAAATLLRALTPVPAPRQEPFVRRP
ncbi:MAG: hypothetical protein WBA67_01770 [Jannaschia sp.]